MKANELMIGDWVIVYHPTMPAESIQISADWLRTIERINNGLIKEDSPLFRIVEPIPLTAKILERNGAFKNPLMGEQRHFIYNLGGFELLAIYDADFSFQINGGAMKIKYIHELQNAIRLCGIDKEIKL